jgi:nucleotide-binding universal stress UspA family protein
MYKEILVPLDGSPLAEAALPDATAVAKAFGGRISVLFVLEPIGLYPQQSMVLSPMIPPPLSTDEGEESARKYLDQMVRRLTMDGVDARYVLKEGDPASEICDYTEAEKIDLIVMSTHGRSGLKRWVYGSVADRVLREASVPILLIRSHTK